MGSPAKPWEVATAFNPSTTPLYVPNTDRLHSTAIPFPGSGGGGSATISNSVGAAPPLPPRPSPNQTRPIYSAYNRTSMMPYSSYSSPYGGFGYSGGYSQYSPYSPYGGGYGFGGAGMGGMYGNRPYYDGVGEPSFSQIAEESSASAFQSIESFVSAFGSISMMLESTFHALFSSFRAVVGVADHLGRMKQIFSALAIFRFFKWMMRRIMYLIGISKIKPETIESLWKEATNIHDADDSQEWLFKGETSRPSSWPILMFLGFIFAGPYLMWKLVKSLNLDGSQSIDKHKSWASGDSDHFVAEVKFPFEAASDRELNLRSGQTIRLAPAKFQPNNVRGWALASDGSRIGLVPLNYIKVLGKRTEYGMNLLMKNKGNENPAPLHPTLAQAETQTPRPRVRFDLNPRPPTSTSDMESMDSKAEPSGILIKSNTPSSVLSSANVNDDIDDGSQEK